MGQHYIKHLIECKCILKIFEDREPPVFHQFVAFSEFDNNTGDMIASYAQCNNCGVIHKITEVATSTIIKKEEMKTLPTKEELELNLPEKVVSLLKANECDLHVWQEANHIMEHKLWGKFVVLSREKENLTTHGKALVIFGESLFKIEKFQYDDEVSLNSSSLSSSS